MLKWKGFYWLAIWAVAFICGCSGNNSAANDPIGNKDLSADNQVEAAGAEAIYKQSCITCHGNQLQGRSGPKLKTIGSKLTEQQIITMIENGGRGMPAFKERLEPEQIQLLAGWLAAKK